MRYLLLLLFICTATVSSAQTSPPTTAKTVIGYFNYDSLFVLMPGYKEMQDTSKIYNDQLAALAIALDSRQHEFDSLNMEWSATIKKIKQMEIDDLKNNLASFRLEARRRHSQSMLQFDIKITEAAGKIAKAKGYTTVLHSEISDAFAIWSAPGVEFKDMTTDICAELGIRK